MKFPNLDCQNCIFLLLIKFINKGILLFLKDGVMIIIEEKAGLVFVKKTQIKLKNINNSNNNKV